MTKGLVIFAHNTGVWWLRFLKPGFRHCFIILETDRGCVCIDPISNRFTISMLEGYELKALLHWYRDMGMKVMNVGVDHNNCKSFFWAPMTCVEVVKRLIGLRESLILTPWQLYRYLKKNKK